MKKYLVQIDFRYDNSGGDYVSKKITVGGVFDDFDTAAMAGNEVLKGLEKRFPLHRFPDGSLAAKARLGRNLGPFGTNGDIVSNTGYLKTPFVFYVTVNTLYFDDIAGVVDIALSEIG